MKKLLFLLLMLISSAYGVAQQHPKVDFLTASATLQINPVKQSVKGVVTYDFMVNTMVDTIAIDAHKMEFTNLTINTHAVEFKTTDKALKLYKGFKPGKNSLTFTYEAYPTQALYFVNKDYYQDVQIWSQGQGKFTSHWFPSFDDQNEKIVFNLQVDFHKDYTVLANGVLTEVTTKGEEKSWKYQMQKPMSSYLLMIAIGRFEKKEFTSASGVKNELWYHYLDKKKAEPTYRYSKEIFDYLEKEIQVAYPWQIYRQVPVWDFLYGGMENTTSTIFSQEYVVDEIGFNDRNYVNVNAHELAHQWFGDLITAKTNTHHWLQEGFATYYALLAEKHIFGDDYFYWKLFENARKIEMAQHSDTEPILSEKASSLTYYQKGAWAIHVIREAVGEKVFREIIKNYLNEFGFKNVTTQDLFKHIKAHSNFDTDAFSRNWLETQVFQKDQVMTLLKKNKFITQYLDLEQNPLDPINDKEKIIKIIESNVYYPVKNLLLSQLTSVAFKDKKDILIAALKTNSIPVRQAVAVTLTEIPEEFKELYESLLNDKSYLTQEVALMQLANSFQDDVVTYADLSKDWVGFGNYNLKIHHLTLAFISSYTPEEQADVYLKLLNFSGTNYEATTRQLALESLLNLGLRTPLITKSLAFGTSHFKWRFAMFCREQLKEILTDKDLRYEFEQEIMPELPFKEKTIVERLLTQLDQNK